MKQTHNMSAQTHTYADGPGPTEWKGREEGENNLLIYTLGFIYDAHPGELIV